MDFADPDLKIETLAKCDCGLIIVCNNTYREFIRKAWKD